MLPGQLRRNGMEGKPIQKQPVYLPDGFRFALVYHNAPIRSFVITQEPAVGKTDLPVRKPLPVPPCGVLRNGTALFLRERGHDGDQQLPFAVECPYVFLFKIDLYAFLLQLPHRGQAVHRIPGKSADRLGDDQVYLPGKRIRHHLFKTLPMPCIRCADPFIRIYPGKLPIITPLDVRRIIIHLRRITCDLIFMVGADPRIPGDSPLYRAAGGNSRKTVDGGRDCFYFLVDAQYFSLLTFFIFSLMAFLRSSVNVPLMDSLNLARCSSVHGLPWYRKSYWTLSARPSRKR